jgi:hypothetical protein
VFSAQGDVTITWDQETPGAHFHQRVVIGTTSGRRDYDLEILLRILAHFLVNRLPNDALREACETMADIYEYHVARGNYLYAARPPAREIMKANAARAYERPGFGLEEG